MFSPISSESGVEGLSQGSVIHKISIDSVDKTQCIEESTIETAQIIRSQRCIIESGSVVTWDRQPAKLRRALT